MSNFHCIIIKSKLEFKSRLPIPEFSGYHCKWKRILVKKLNKAKKNVKEREREKNRSERLKFSPPPAKKALNGMALWHCSKFQFLLTSYIGRFKVKRWWGSICTHIYLLGSASRPPPLLSGGGVETEKRKRKKGILKFAHGLRLINRQQELRRIWNLSKYFQNIKFYSIKIKNSLSQREN